MTLPSIAKCELKVLSQLSLSMKAHRFTTSRKQPMEKKTPIFPIGDRTGLLFTFLPGSPVRTMSRAALQIPQNIFTAALDVWLTHFFKASHSESDHVSTESSQGLIHNPPTTQPISQIFTWSLLLLELPFNCLCRKENFCSYEIFMPVRFTPRLFLHSWNL